MPVEIRDAELFTATADSFALSFSVGDASGPVAASARILVDGELRHVSEELGTHLVRIAGLAPDTEHRIEIQVPGAPPLSPTKYFSGKGRTLPAPRAKCVARFATLNDLHFGEPRFGGTLLEN